MQVRPGKGMAKVVSVLSRTTLSGSDHAGPEVNSPFHIQLSREDETVAPSSRKRISAAGAKIHLFAGASKASFPRGGWLAAPSAPSFSLSRKRPQQTFDQKPLGIEDRMDHSDQMRIDPLQIAQHVEKQLGGVIRLIPRTSG